MAFSLDTLGTTLRQGFERASNSTSAGLRDDEVVRATARHIYDVIPFPLNLAIKMSVGIEGLERFALTVRDQLLAAGFTDVAKLGQSEWQALIAASLASVPGLGRLVVPGVAPVVTQAVAGGSGRVEQGARAAGAAPEPADAAPLAMAVAAPLPAGPQSEPPAVWYLLRNDAQYGPWPDASFIAFVEQGRLDRNDLVWRDGFPGWIALRDLPSMTDGLLSRPGQR